MKKSPPYLVYDAANSLLLGSGDTEKAAVAAACKFVSSPKRVTIHHLGNTYSKRTVIIGEDGIIGGKKNIDEDDGHPMGQSG